MEDHKQMEPHQNSSTLDQWPGSHNHHLSLRYVAIVWNRKNGVSNLTGHLTDYHRF